MSGYSIEVRKAFTFRQDITDAHGQQNRTGSERSFRPNFIIVFPAANDVLDSLAQNVPAGVRVRFFDPDEPLDRRPVEHDIAVESLLELRRRDLDDLVHDQDVGELE